MKDKRIVRIIVSLILFIIGLLCSKERNISLICLTFSYIVIGYDILWEAVKNCIHLKLFDEAFLMTIATIGAFAIGEFAEGVAVMLFFQIGEYLQEKAMGHSKDSIRGLMELKVDTATVVRKGKEQVISAEQVKIGETIIIKPGEKVALDGVVIEGTSNLDTMSLTGESIPVSVSVGSNILSGSINLESLLKVKTTSSYENSTVSKMIHMMEQINQSSAKTEKFITKFSKIYTPVVVFLALLIALVPSVIIGNSSEWIHRALVFLVISCPCALVLSIPLGFFCGIGRASKYGILLKNSEVMENLASAKTIVFDKTGTLTEGNFKVDKIISDTLTKDELLKLAAYAEHYSNHPIAQSIKEEYQKEIDESQISSYQEVAGYGIKVKIGKDQIMVGNEKMLEHINVSIPSSNVSGTIVYFVVNHKCAGMITISDVIKKDSYDLITTLEKVGVKRFIVLSGDHESVVSKVSQTLGISEFYSRLLPTDKVRILRKIKKEVQDPMIFVGDGINDTLALASADVGISLGEIGSAAAIEASDAVIMNDKTSLIATAIDLAKKTKRIIWENIVFAILIKIIVLLLGSLGIVNIWWAVFSDVGVTILAILNSMRILKMKIKVHG